MAMPYANKQPSSFLGLTSCPLNVPAHTVGFGLVAYSLYLSYRVWSNMSDKKTGVKMPITFDFFGRPVLYAHPCIGAALYPSLIILQASAEWGYGLAREAAANAKKAPAQCPLNYTERFWIQAFFGFSLVTLFAQSVATRVVVDQKTPDEVEVDNLHAAANKPYTLAPWQIVVPFVIAFIPTAVAAVYPKKR